MLKILKDIEENLEQYLIKEKAITSSDKAKIKNILEILKNKTSNFVWVETEYKPLFEEAGVDRTASTKDCITRMKKFFSENPEIRKHEVIEATKMYLQNVDINYARNPAYFIFKGRGTEKISDLNAWVEKYKKYENENKTSITDITNKLQ